MTCYEYQCSGCGHVFDQDYQIGKAPADGVKCPKCGKRRASKMFGNPWVSWVVYPHNNPFQKMQMEKAKDERREYRS